MKNIKDISNRIFRDSIDKFAMKYFMHNNIHNSILPLFLTYFRKESYEGLIDLYGIFEDEDNICLYIGYIDLSDFGKNFNQDHQIIFLIFDRNYKFKYVSIQRPYCLDSDSNKINMIELWDNDVTGSRKIYLSYKGYQENILKKLMYGA